jgi:hypothetical protein
MSFTFEDATPVKRTIAGRTPEPNPFVDLVKAIGNKIDPKTKQAQAKSFLADKPKTDAKDDVAKVALDKIKRQIGFAGPLAELTPPVSALKHVDFEPKDDKGKVIPGKVRVTVWTGPQQTRVRESKPASNTEALKTNTETK